MFSSTPGRTALTLRFQNYRRGALREPSIARVALKMRDSFDLPLRETWRFAVSGFLS